MIVEKDLVFFQILWKNKEDMNDCVKRTRDLIEEWLKNEESELSLRDCGPAGNDVVYWAFKKGYQENREEMNLLFMHLRKLIKLLRENDDVRKVWLKWDNITDDLFWDTNDSIFEYFNRKEYQKEEYVLIHENKEP